MGSSYTTAFLFQGPLPNTCGNFWEMVWEQRSRGVVMLNRVIEKGSVSTSSHPHSWTSPCMSHSAPVTSLLFSVRYTLCPVHLKVKCAQYWPHREEKDAVFEDTNFKLTLVSEDIKSYYTVRQLELENLSVSIWSPKAVCKRRYSFR